MWLAVDDATKKAKIKVIQIETVYGGVDYSWSRYGGEITAIISGEKVADVKSGLQYAKDYIENKSGNYSLNEEGHLAIMWIMYHGSESIIRSLWDLVRELLLPILYLHGGSMYGLDKALKAADVKIAELSEIPSRVNTGGAIVYGTESACRSAVEAFAEGVEYCAFHPMNIE